jgi:hypothetical protein
LVSAIKLLRIRLLTHPLIAASPGVGERVKVGEGLRDRDARLGDTVRDELVCKEER